MPLTPILPLPELAHHLALVPLLWLGLLALRGRGRGSEWWWLAGAFAVSWLADSAAHTLDPALVSVVYPISQAALVVAVYAPREDAGWFLVTLVVLGLVSSLWGLGSLIVRAAAWGGLVALIWNRAVDPLRRSLVVGYGGGLAAWVLYTAFPGWLTWGVYQAIRALAYGLFCWAAERPTLRLAR